MPVEAGWHLLVISLPSTSATARMRIWRALKGAGSAVLRDGVYLLPHQDGLSDPLQHQADEVVRAGGTAYLLKLAGEEGKAFQLMFDRSAEYARLMEAIQGFRVRLGEYGAAEARRGLRQLRRDFEAIRAIDYFPGAGREQMEQALSEAEAAAAALIAPGEPRPVASEIARMDTSDLRARIGRRAGDSGWIGPQAPGRSGGSSIPTRDSYAFKSPRDCPADAIGFDFDGAAFTHVGALVTFEAPLASFGLDSDPALARLGALVNHLDVGGIPVAEAAGLRALLSAARARCPDDNALLAEAASLFDLLYTAYQEEERS